MNVACDYEAPMQMLTTEKNIRVRDCVALIIKILQTYMTVIHEIKIEIYSLSQVKKKKLLLIT